MPTITNDYHDAQILNLGSRSERGPYLVMQTGAEVDRRSGVKQTLLIIAGLFVAGCCSTQNELQHLSTSDLQLRRYELSYCLSTTRMSWDNRPWQTHAYDVKADLEEKEAIEREITRRGVTNYHWPPSVTDRYAHDHCHCQCWIATL